MDIVTAHSIFREQYNVHNTNIYRELSNYQIDNLFRDATMLVIDEFMDKKIRGRQAQEFLQGLLTPINLVPSQLSDSKYTIDLSALEVPYYRFEKMKIKTSCSTKYVDLISTHVIGSYLDDVLQKPSKKWKRMYATLEGTDQIIIYTESGWEPTGVELTYARRPKDPFYGGYDSPAYLNCQQQGLPGCDQFYQQGDPQVEIDVDPDFHRLVIDRAVLEAHRALERGNAFQLSHNKVINES